MWTEEWKRTWAENYNRLLKEGVIPLRKEKGIPTPRTQKWCHCEDWEKGIKTINAMIIFCHDHFLAPKYTSPTFDSCPWCGRLLFDVQKEGD